MAPADRARVVIDQRNIEITLERNREVLRDTRAKEQRYSETLRRSDVELRSARRDLRRAGYLK